MTCKVKAAAFLRSTHYIKFSMQSISPDNICLFQLKKLKTTTSCIVYIWMLVTNKCLYIWHVIWLLPQILFFTSRSRLLLYISKQYPPISYMFWNTKSWLELILRYFWISPHCDFPCSLRFTVVFFLTSVKRVCFLSAVLHDPLPGRLRLTDYRRRTAGLQRRSWES